MIPVSGVEACKVLADNMADLIPGGVEFGIVEGDIVTWTRMSVSMDIEIIKNGQRLSEGSSTVKAIRETKTVIQKIPRSVYGKRLTIVSIPIVDENGKSTSAFSIAFPKFHPVAQAFGDFAPVISEMFAEGSFMYVTDLQKVVSTQHSKKFDMPTIKEGHVLKEEDIASKTIKSKSHSMDFIDASKFGVPISVSNYPLFDEENKDEIVATLGICTPKQTAVNLQDMAGNLNTGLDSISAAIEEMAASATEIHSNEQSLNDKVKDVIKISDEINEVSMFIKDIADETKMLGLNAAIEAARAGEFGRGFGVVAEQIRRLSDQSKSTVPKIKKLTEDIKERVEIVSEKSEGSLQSSQEQAAATQEITANIEEITSLAKELERIADTL